MASSTTKTLTKWLLITFILWYLLRQTGLGRAYSGDMLAIPKQLGVAEGLKSASQYIKP